MGENKNKISHNFKNVFNFNWWLLQRSPTTSSASREGFRTTQGQPVLAAGQHASKRQPIKSAWDAKLTTPYSRSAGISARRTNEIRLRSIEHQCAKREFRSVVVTAAQQHQKRFSQHLAGFNKGAKSETLDDLRAVQRPQKKNRRTKQGLVGCRKFAAFPVCAAARNRL